MADRRSAFERALAFTRFGMGARPGDWASAEDARKILKAQIGAKNAAQTPAGDLPDARSAFNLQFAYRQERRAEAEAAAGTRSANAQPANRPADQPTPEQAAALTIKGAELLRDEIRVRVAESVDEPQSFAERWALFWSNHFTVAAVKAASLAVAGPFEREAIRPKIWGRFADMLRTAATHQGMLLYLDQAGSFGPDSLIGRRRDRGINENLAREIMELHTIGVDGGYTQADVTEFARALSGWTIVTPPLEAFLARIGQEAKPGEVRFVDGAHEPGARTILGKTYAQNGSGQSLAVLDDLAARPATARHIAVKLASHFSADQPEATLVRRLEDNFLASRGDLAALARTLVDSPEMWVPSAKKFKTPNEFLVSSLRAAGVKGTDLRFPDLRGAFELLGQPPFRAPSPKGWPDDAQSWAGSDAILKRVEFAQSLANRIGGSIGPAAFAENALGPLLSDKLKVAMAGADNPAQAIVLVLMSPEFQRR